MYSLIFNSVYDYLHFLGTAGIFLPTVTEAGDNKAEGEASKMK